MKTILAITALLFAAGLATAIAAETFVGPLPALVHPGTLFRGFVIAGIALTVLADYGRPRKLFTLPDAANTDRTLSPAKATRKAVHPLAA